MKQRYDRVAILPVEAGLGLIMGGSNIRIDGANVNVRSTRTLTFVRHGTYCHYPGCDLVATHFAVERDIKSKSNVFHLNLWHATADGEEILFTCDHILARSLGGEQDKLYNTQTMCERHNSKKSRFEQVISEAMKRSEYWANPILIVSEHKSSNLIAA